MLLAQALGEYGLVTGLVAAFDMVRLRVEDSIRNAEPQHYIMVGVAVLVLWMILGRR